MAENQRKYSNTVGPITALKRDGNTFLYFGCEGHMSRIKVHSGQGQDGQPYKSVTASIAVNGHARAFNNALPDLKIVDENSTVWVSLRFSGNTADRIIKVLNLSQQEPPKSVHIAVFGSLSMNAYTGNNGVEYKSPKISVSDFWLLGRKQDNAQGAAPAVPAADHSGDGSACPPSRGTEPQAAAASDCPGAAASGQKEGLGSCGSGTGSRKADTPSADGRGAPGSSPGTVPAAPAEAAAEAPGTLIPVCPAVHNTPAGKIPAGVFFYLLRKNLQSPACTPAPKPV